MGRRPTRKPGFLQRIPAQPQVALAFAPHGQTAAVPEPVPQEETPPPVYADPDPEMVSAMVGERLAGAIASLGQMTERLTAEAQADALEVGFLVARRIIEDEVQGNVEALLSLVRTALRRLGESRHVIIRLCPDDAKAVEEVMAAQGAKAIAETAIAQIELKADPSLQRCDCMVEGDLGSVDGRLNTRLDELRHAALTGAMGDVA
jgi:flagellar assembly protein FliH